MSTSVASMAADVRAALRLRAGSTLTRIWLPLAIVYVVWGSTYLGIRVAIDTIPPVLMMSARFLIAGVLLYGFSLWRGEIAADRPGPKQWLAALAIGGALLVAANGGVVLAERTVPTGVVALIVATVPLWMAIIDRIAFHRRLSWRVVTGLVVGFGGVALLLGSPGPGRIDPGGALLALLSPVCWAAGSVFARHARLPIRPLVATAMQMLAAGGVLAVLGTIAGEWSHVQLSAISRSSLVALAYLIVFGSIIAFSAYVWLLRAAPLSLVSTYAYVNPVVAVLLGWAILGEAIGLRTLLAGGVIVAAVALIVSAKLRPVRTQPAALSPR